MMKFIYLKLLIIYSLLIMNCGVYPARFLVGEEEKRMKKIKVESNCGIIEISGEVYSPYLIFMVLDYTIHKNHTLKVFPSNLSVTHLDKFVTNTWSKPSTKWDIKPFVIEGKGKIEFMIRVIYGVVELEFGTIDLDFNNVFECNGKNIDMEIIKIY